MARIQKARIKSNVVEGQCPNCGSTFQIDEEANVQVISIPSDDERIDDAYDEHDDEGSEDDDDGNEEKIDEKTGTGFLDGIFGIKGG